MFIYSPHTTTIWEELRTDCLIELATLSFSGSNGPNVLSILKARCGHVNYGLAIVYVTKP